MKEEKKELKSSDGCQFDPDLDGWDELPEEWYQRNWWEWLEEKLAFPFSARRIEDDADAYFADVDDEPFRLGHQMQVIQLAEEDEDRGILALITEGNHAGTAPLADLEVLPRNDPNYTPLRHYTVWIANRY